MNFTFVCPTEIAEFGKRNEDFRDRDTQVLGMSTDTHFVHLAWRRDLVDPQGVIRWACATGERASPRSRWRDVDAHEKTVTEGGLTSDHVNDAVRIAATVYAAAVALETGEAGATEAPPMEVSARGA